MNINGITPDGWLSFTGSMVGAVITAISVIIAIRTSSKQINLQKIQSLRTFHDALKESLPSYESIMTQSDYLDEDDSLLGGFVPIEARIDVLENRLKDGDDADGLLRYRIEQHKKYMEYWNKANSNIQNFIHSGYFNAVRSACCSEVLECYSCFLVAFSNEHFYCGPVIDSNLLRGNLYRLFESIREAEKV